MTKSSFLACFAANQGELFSAYWLALLCFAFDVGQWKRNATWWYSQYVWTRCDTTCKKCFHLMHFFCFLFHLIPFFVVCLIKEISPLSMLRWVWLGLKCLNSKNTFWELLIVGLYIFCSFVWDKIWLEADTWKVWTWCKDGTVLTSFSQLSNFKSCSTATFLRNCVNEAF